LTKLALTPQAVHLQAQCYPALLPEVNPFLRSETHFDSTQPVLNVAAFEPLTGFSGYTGSGRVTQNFRRPGYFDFDLGLQKFFCITEKVNFQLRGDAFNAFNGHHFMEETFNTDVSNPQTFGIANLGAVSAPPLCRFQGGFRSKFVLWAKPCTF
jgi:hypothetical protein